VSPSVRYAEYCYAECRGALFLGLKTAPEIIQSILSQCIAEVQQLPRFGWFKKLETLKMISTIVGLLLALKVTQRKNDKTTCELDRLKAMDKTFITSNWHSLQKS
jgi:hypothetical protein